MSKINKYIMYIILLFILITTGNSYALENIDINSQTEVPVDVENTTRIDIDNKTILTEKILMETEITGSYDIRKDISNLKIKNQGRASCCWAFSTLNVLETNLLRTKGIDMDFSERHMNYGTSNSFTNGSINPNSYNRTAKDGGNPIIGMSYMTSGQGPILEKDMPFVESEEPIDIAEINNKKVQRKINDYIIFPAITKVVEDGEIIYKNPSSKTEEIYLQIQVENIRNDIKRHILQYGGLTAMTMSGSAFSEYYNYNAQKDGKIYPAYYCDNTAYTGTPNHQVVIVGWDDNYSKNNFNASHRPIHDGAYLVMNSYGKQETNPDTNFKEGLYYISYDDIHIEASPVGIINTSYIDYDHIYQHDKYGISSSLKINNVQYVYGANIFNRNTNNTEILTQISISSQVNVKCDIYINPISDDISNLSNLTLIKQGVDIRAGYTTIKLDNSIILNNSKFAIVVKYYSKSDENYAYIGVEKPLGPNVGYDYWNVAISSRGESLISISTSNNLSWIDLVDSEMKNTNLCIKAFTYEASSNTPYTIKESNISNIMPNTSFEDFEKNMTKAGNNIKEQIDREGQIIKTGMKLNINNKTYEMSVKGDIDGNGMTDSSDVIAMRMAIIHLKKLNGGYEEAADVDRDGRYATAADFARILDYTAGLTQNL